MRRSRLFLVPSLLVGMPVLASCTALYYPGDDYVTGSPLGDASPSPESSMPIEASVQDAPSDGSEASAPAGPLVCPANAYYCDDFERDDVKGPYWTLSGGVAIDSTQHHSPTRSLSATTVSGGDSSYVQQDGPVGPKTRFDFWFYTPTVVPPGGLNFRIAHQLWGDNCDWDLTWELLVNASDGLVLSAATYDKSMNASCGPVAAKVETLLTPDELYTARWHHAVMIGDTSQQQKVVSVQIDDSGIFTTVTVEATRVLMPTSATVALGLPCIRPDDGGCITYSGPVYEVWTDDLILAPD